MKSASFDLVAQLLHSVSGLVVGIDKMYLLETRLSPVMKTHKITDLDMLADRIRAGRPSGITNAVISNPTPLEAAVIEAMTTNESFFFRDEKPFTHVRNHALPRLLANRPPGSKLRIWSAATSSGQEAYSLAMLITEMKGQIGNRSFEILGTDIAREQLARAEQGVYSQFEVQRGLPMHHLVKYFRKDGSNWRLIDEIRNMVHFRAFNLLQDLRSLGQFDIVFCRNVLIYFDQQTKARVLAAIAKQMPADGVLYLGGAETVLGITDVFASAPGERGVYELAPAPAKRPMVAATR